LKAEHEVALEWKNEHITGLQSTLEALQGKLKNAEEVVASWRHDVGVVVHKRVCFTRTGTCWGMVQRFAATQPPCTTTQFGLLLPALLLATTIDYLRYYCSRTSWSRGSSSGLPQLPQAVQVAAPSIFRGSTVDDATRTHMIMNTRQDELLSALGDDILQIARGRAHNGWWSIHDLPVHQLTHWRPWMSADDFRVVSNRLASLGFKPLQTIDGYGLLPGFGRWQRLVPWNRPAPVAVEFGFFLEMSQDVGDEVEREYSFSMSWDGWDGEGCNNHHGCADTAGGLSFHDIIWPRQDTGHGLTGSLQGGGDAAGGAVDR